METAPQFFRHGPSPLARLFIFAMLSCLLIAEDTHFKYFPQLRQAIGVIIFPLQRIAYTPADIYDQVEKFITSFNLLEENIKLRQLYLERREQLLRLDALEAENTHLRRLLGAVQEIETTTKTKVVLAEIQYTPRDPFNHKITLNKGSYHDIELGQAVIDDKGIIGQITLLYPWSSEVTLLTDKDHAVPIQVVRNGLRSVISGTGKNNELELRYLSVNTDIQQDDLLVTSGIGGVYPPGIPVATVRKIEQDPMGDFALVTSTPIAGVDRNRQVLVLSLAQTESNDSQEMSTIGSGTN
ncbi:rod shape-determining protein MreC [Nitrosomonas ureae]|uniref:Cell shape-determining protein MreC n=1 Tax=Nitrosomonas ureae TaxID=44577 RepID=A0A0S3AHM0_9PROT|nr:rod shape-determining protein MreC [Nitrosomonas ureae]ALQ50528.1 rod shape-determining protein MreC [Nitrosomonas ureae]PTQ82375.1 rod shape-determining protein MreC [Nitrosomonas ureae]PXX14011.1 rod shape-determining protein MreC [Nitrosomonas ureae]SDT86369.1 rod shape-determining protein MreC [Nitrosomonas ureae]SEP81576.1 rod shape-determining protein MreC [Nitrosomonas ureae]